MRGSILWNFLRLLGLDRRRYIRGRWAYPERRRSFKHYCHTCHQEAEHIYIGLQRGDGPLEAWKCSKCGTTTPIT
jgi:hypothetical protein